MTTTQTENNTQHKESQQKRVQLNHLLIDVDFFDKPKVRALIYRHTQLSALLYMRWLMLMSRATNALVTRDALFSVAREVLQGAGSAIATPETVLAYCLKTEMLTQLSEDEFTNERVVKDQESCAIKRESANERQKKYKAKNDIVSNALVTRLPVTGSVTDTELDPRKGVQGETQIFEVKEVQKQPDDWLETRKMPETLRDAVQRWRENLRKNGRDYDEIQFEAHACNYGQRLKQFEIDLNYSAAANWKTLHSKPPDPLPESEKIAIAAREKAQVLKPVEKPRPQPPPLKPEKVETPSPEAVRKFKEAVANIGRKMPQVVTA